MDYQYVKNVIDTTIENADPQISTESGTITGLITSAAAVPIAGLYGYADNVGRKPFVDVCDIPDLLHHAKIKGVVIPDGMDDDELRSRMMTASRIPPSGADLFSWENNIYRATENMPGIRFRLFENSEARGMASVDVVLSHTANNTQLSNVRSALDAFRPYGLADLQTSIARPRNIELRVQVRGRAVSFQALENAIMDNYGSNGSAGIGESINETNIYGIASNFAVSTAVMSWRNQSDSSWILGGCEAIKEFKNRFSFYEQLICTRCFIEEL